MKRIFLFSLLVVVACNKTELESPCNDNLSATFESCSSVVNVTADRCIIKEAITQDPREALPIDKFVYHHDGTNYDKIDRYYREDYSKPFPVTPQETLNFTYHPNGLISQVRWTSFLIPGTAYTTLFTYTYSDTKLNVRIELLNSNGSRDFISAYDEFYLLSAPKDSLYFFDGPFNDNFDHRTLHEFKDANVKRTARPWKDGVCSIYGAKWLFEKNYYDNLPNVLKNYAVRFPLDQGKGFYGTMTASYTEVNANNIIGRIYNDGADHKTQYCWTFLKNASNTYWIKTFRLIGGPSTLAPNYVLTYHYDCE